MPPGFDVRAVPEREIDDMLALGYLAFHERIEPDERVHHERFLRIAHRFGAYDGGELAGMAAAIDLELAVPGAELPCAGLTWVAVKPTHRRRGALTGLMAELLGDALRRGAPLAALWAAEGAIYGRFGFGVATYAQEAELDTRAPLPLRVEPDPRPLRLIDHETVPARLARVHGRERARRHGLVARSPEWWREGILHTPPEVAAQGLADALVVVLGDRDDPAGYAIYRVRAPDDFDDDKPGRVEVQELVADTAAGAAALWRYLASIDLTATLGAWNLPVDDPLPLLVADPDRARLTRRLPALWLRLLDVPRALAARDWTVPPDVAVGVRDPLLPDNAGTWRLAPGGCERTDAPPDVELDVRDLAAAYLGGVSVAALRAAGLVEERTEGAVAALDAALRTPLAPHALDDF